MSEASDIGASPRAVLGLASLQSPWWGGSGRRVREFSYLDQAYDAGYRAMDTAAIYGLGASETTLGQWLELRRNRAQVKIITKGGHPRLWRPRQSRIRVDCIAADLAASLRRLRTDYIDLYLLHRDDAACDLNGILQYLDEQKRLGTVRAIGVSNWHHDRIEAANALARRQGLTPFSVSSPQLSLLSWTTPPWRASVSISGSEGATARLWYRDTQMTVLAWSPFGGAMADLPGGWMPTGACYNHPVNQQRLARAATVARDKGITVPQVLMAYLASMPFPVHPVCASRNLDHLRANRAALNVTLSTAEVSLLESP